MTHTKNAASTRSALAEIESARTELGDFIYEDLIMPDGSLVSVASILDDLKADYAAEQVVDALTEVALAGERH